MIRLVTVYGSRERDEDVLIVVDELEEVSEGLRGLVLTKGDVDLHILTTKMFMRLLTEDPFYVNVLINGDHKLNTFTITEDIKNTAIKRAKGLVKEMCKKGHKGISLGYYYLISRGIFPKDRHEIKELLGRDKGDDFSFICHTIES